VICGQCHSFSAHLYEILGSELGPWDGMTMKREFCDALTSQCAGQIVFGGPAEYDGLDFCDKHVGDTNGDDRFWSYPYQEGEGSASIARLHTYGVAKHAANRFTNGLHGKDLRI